MQHLLPLAAILLLSIIPVEAEVVASVEHCNEFFLQQTPPQIPRILEGGIIQDKTRYKWICQTYKNRKTFVTLYDTHNKIPVFSAAQYRGEDGETIAKRPKWMIEPQNTIYEHQAENENYKNGLNFTRGHLFPRSYGSNYIEQRSTFTMTNIVPQKDKFNHGSWNKMEKCVKCILNNYCNNMKTFVVIGAKPSDSRLNHLINIPSVLWSAFCCYSEKQRSWLASAHWGKNNRNGPKYLLTRTLTELKTTLRIEPFPHTPCPLHTTVTHLYSDLSSNCNC
ncbi:hypothetical protein ACER0C_001278 [Sarotherodon galilaeus]